MTSDETTPSEEKKNSQENGQGKSPDEDTRSDPKTEDTKSPEPILYFEFNGQRFELDCRTLEGSPLRDALNLIRSDLNLHNTVILKARVSSSVVSLDQEAQISTVLAELDGGRFLVISIHNLDSLCAEPVTDPKVAKIHKQKLAREVHVKYIGANKIESNIVTQEPIYTISQGVVQIPQGMLVLLRERIEDDLTVFCINHFVGLFFGGVIGLLVPLLGDGLKDSTRGISIGALSVSLLAAIFLIVLEVLVIVKRKKMLEPIMSKLPIEGDHDGRS